MKNLLNSSAHTHTHADQVDLSFSYQPYYFYLSLRVNNPKLFNTIKL